jgi:hypothetical protein
MSRDKFKLAQLLSALVYNLKKTYFFSFLQNYKKPKAFFCPQLFDSLIVLKTILHLFTNHASNADA